MFFRIINNLTKNHEDLLQGFMQMVFNVFANNRDDHAKNFAFVMDHNGKWSLSPAYDLTYSTGPGGEHSMTIDGEGKEPTKEHINSLGVKMGINKKVITGIIEKTRYTISNWPEYANQAGVSDETMDEINEKLNF